MNTFKNTLKRIRPFKIAFLILFSVSIPCYSQGWDDCCKGYEKGYRNGYSYPNLNNASLVVTPPCNCNGIMGTLNYEAGYVKGYEDGRLAKARFEQQRQQPPPQQRTQYQTNPYVHPYPQGTYRIKSNENSTPPPCFIFGVF